MADELKIIQYPDPRLKKISAPITKFDPSLISLADQMFQLMKQAKGVGLAAPQVGHNIRLFVMNPTGQPDDDRVYINPELFEPSGEEESEEGCLSLPGINTNVTRSRTITLRAQNLEGEKIAQTESGYLARIWQHEIDHLNGTLIIDRIGPGARMMFRPILRELEEKYDADHPAPAKARARR